MTEIYERDWRNGVPAPFLEYALSSTWMDTSYTHRWRMWKDGEKIAAFVFHEDPISDVYISLRPGYEELADELAAYASSDMPKQNGKNRLVLFEGQAAVMEAAKRAGYVQTGGYNKQVFAFSKPLDYPLPEGFRFVEPGELDPAKIAECCWKGFDHEKTEGPWDGNYESALRLIAAPMPRRPTLWPLRTNGRSTSALRACGGRRKTIWPTWSRFAPSPDTAAGVWLPPPSRSCTAG